VINAMRLFSTYPHPGLLYRSGGFVLGAGLALACTSISSAAIFKNGFVNHAICCATGGPLNFDGLPVRNSAMMPHMATGVGSAGGVKSSSVLVASVSPVSTPAGGVSPTAAAVTETDRAAAAPKEVGGYLLVDFARLSDFKIESEAFDPNVKTETALAAVDQQIPAAIKQFNGRQVQITGFMLPVKMEGQLVSEFLLMRDQMMCCYGVIPRMNDWIVVRTSKAVRYIPDLPVHFRGKFQVKAMQEQGFITGIYLLEEATPGKL
jgi:hypothetical protein